MRMFVCAALRAALLAAGLAAAFPLSASAQGAAQPPVAAPVAGTHEDQLRQIFLDARIVSMARKGALTAARPGYQRALFERVFQARSDEALAAAYARQVAKDVTVQDAAALRRLTSMPAMRAMMVEMERAMLAAPGQRPDATPEGRRLSKEVERQARPGDMQTFSRMAPVFKGFPNFLRGEIDAYDAELTRRFAPILVQMARLSTREDFKAAEIPTARVGFEPVDRILDVYGESLHATAALIERTTRANEAIEIDTLLLPQHMVHRPGIERGRAMLAQVEQITAGHLAAFQDIYTARADKIRAALQDLPGFDGAKLDAQASQTMEFMLKVGENRQRQYAALRRMLAFAEARIGQTTLKDGLLIFPNDADLQTWQAMAAEIEQLDSQGNQDQAARQEQERKMIGTLEKKL